MSPRTRIPSPQIGGAVRKLDISKLSGETARLTNAQVAEHIGKIVAKEIQAIYSGEDLKDLLTNLDKNMLRLSWG
jgi:hypothetical protein